MFERYTEPARRVLFFSRFEASVLGGSTIETEHMLLGLLRESSDLMAAVFARAGIRYDEIRAEIEAGKSVKDRVETSKEIPFSAEMKRVLQRSVEEADRLL